MWKPGKDGSCPVVVAPGLAGDRGSVWFLGQLSPKDVVHRLSSCASMGDIWDTAPPQIWGTCRHRKAGKTDLRGREAISCSKLVLWTPPQSGNKAQIDFSPLSGTVNASCTAAPIEAASPGVNGANIHCRESRGFPNTWVDFRA